MQYPLYLAVFDVDNVAYVEEPYFEDFVAENLGEPPELLVKLTDAKTAQVLDANAIWQELEASWEADRKHNESFRNPGV
jgi:hypothetical protein